MTYQLTLTEAEAFDEIQRLRKAFNPRLFDQVKVHDRLEALVRAHAVISQVGAAMTKLGLPVNNLEPDHGLGHILRDYCHAMILTSKLKEIDPKHLFVGAVAGALHDLGCALVERYSETETTLRHAEGTTLLLQEIFKSKTFGLNDAEEICIEYAALAHTNYLKPIVIVGKDGVSREILPYQDMDGDTPIYGVHLPRWIDRLETNGPCYVGRHYYTLMKPHKDFSGEIGHYEVDYAGHMRPLLRVNSFEGHTMAEHLRMFASSQSSASIYGKYDLGFMVTLRDKYRYWLEQVIQTTQNIQIIDANNQERILNSWTRFLFTVIEPTAKGVVYAQKQEARFRELPETTRLGWLPAFDLTMLLYHHWADNLSRLIGELPSDIGFTGLDFPGITTDLGNWPFWEDK